MPRHACTCEPQASSVSRRGDDRMDFMQLSTHIALVMADIFKKLAHALLKKAGNHAA